MKDIGKILFPEQYAPAGEEIAVDNSVSALALFEKYYPKGGIVLLGHLQVCSLHSPYILAWMYFMQDKECPQLLSVFPVVKINDLEKLGQLDVMKVTPCENEIVFVFKDTLYCSVFTTKGEIAIMKIRAFLCSKEAEQGIGMLHNKTVSDIYPVDLYSLSEHKFIGICWAVIFAEDDKQIFWYPVCFDEEANISSYSPDDLDDHPVNVGEEAVIGGIKYKLFYNDELGYYFKKKTVPTSEQIGRVREAMKQHAKNFGLRTK